MTRNFLFFLAVLWMGAGGVWGAMTAPAVMGPVVGFVGGAAVSVLLLVLLLVFVLVLYLGCELLAEML